MAQLRLRLPALGSHRRLWSHGGPWEQRGHAGLSHLPAAHSVPLFGSSLAYRKVCPEPGGGLVLPTAKHLYDEFKPKGGLYVFDTGAIGGLGKLVISTHPTEFVKVLQNEGKYPEGLTNVLTQPMKNWTPDMLSIVPAVDLLARRDEVWAEYRASLKGLLSPKSARGHLGNIDKAAQLASKGASACGDDFGTFINRCAFDAFCAVLFGELTQTADPGTPCDPRTEKFLHDVIWWTRASVGIDASFGKMLLAYYASKCGISTAYGEELVERWKNVTDYSEELVVKFVSKAEAQELDEHQKNSYFMSALQRSEDGVTVPHKKLIELAQILLLTSVDTTSAILFSVIVQLALTPEVQRKLADLLQEDLGTGSVSIDMLKGSSAAMEYLDAIIRECHRIRPPLGPVVHFKRAVHDLELHGQTVPKDSLVAFDQYSIQNDPSIVSDPAEFRPERWLPHAVSARQGTPAAIIDHTLLKTPFSSGARQCPAARVATLEVQCILAHLFRDWKFEFAEQTTAKTLADFPNMQLLPGYTHPFPRLKVTSRSL